MKLMHTAGRNMWRNRGRTILSASAIFSSTLAMCLIFSLETGYIDDMRNNIRNHITGDIRIMNRSFIENERIRPLQFFIDDTQPLLAALNKTPLIAFATPRTETVVSIYRGGAQIPCRAICIDFARSPVISGLNNHIISGSVPAPFSSGVLVSKGLADELKLKVGDRFTAITRTAISGSNGKTFTVEGIILMADTDFSGRVFFMDWQTGSGYLRMGGNALQIQVFLDNPEDLIAGDAIVKAAVRGERAAADADDLDIRPWHAVSGMYGFIEVAGLVYSIYGVIFYLLASTVIFNTTMMSVLERRREIGTLGALGMSKARIVALFLAESTLIAALGTAAGLLVGGILVGLWGHFGFNIEAIYGNDMKGFGYSRIVYPALKAGQYIQIFITGITISMAACYLPARMAAKIEPADALADR